MNRMPLLRNTWTILRHNPVLWSIALIGLSIDFGASWVFVVAPQELSVLRTVLAFVLTAFTTGALISAVNAIVEGQPVTLLAGLRAGLQRLPPLLALNLILYVPVWLLIFFLSGSLLATFTSGLGQPGGIQATDVLSTLPSFLGVAGIVIVVTLFMNLIGVGAERAVVIDDRSIIDALKASRQLLTRNVRDYISIGSMLVGIVLGLGLLFTFMLGPLLSALATNLSQVGGAAPQPITITSPASMLYFILSLVINSLYTVFVAAAWTLAYREWQGK